MIGHNLLGMHVYNVVLRISPLAFVLRRELQYQASQLVMSHCESTHAPFDSDHGTHFAKYFVR